MTTSRRLNFGLKDAADISASPAAWGARAIYNRGRPELVWDRQDLVADDEAARSRLKAELNDHRRLAAFLAWARGRFDGASREVKEFVSGPVRFRASTNGSHGYLYVTAVLEGP